MTRSGHWDFARKGATTAQATDAFGPEQVESTMHGATDRAVTADQIKDCEPVPIADDGFTFDQDERMGSLPTANAMTGKRDEKSFPARVISCTPAILRIVCAPAAERKAIRTKTAQ